MCGIVGVLHLDGRPVRRDVVSAMTEAVRHRGPDGHGVFVDRAAGLGHRRLAIIDLSQRAAQPMSSPDGRYHITYNGEVYNYRELKKELSNLGYAFGSESDTEVVLAAFIMWGEEALSRFNGMFAFAVWDAEMRELFLARDRYGIKPLYTAKQKHVFTFASEVKGILAHPEFSARLDEEALLEYFTFQNFFSDKTLFAGVRSFPAGSFMRISCEGRPHAAPTRYWDFCFKEPGKPLKDKEYEEELDRLFRQAVRRQLVSDVEVGSYLSGGMDSGSITAVSSPFIPRLKTFTCGFDLHSASGLELYFDERTKAEHMSYLFDTEHYEIVLKAGDMQRCLPLVVWHLDEPRVGQSYPNFHAAKLAAKFVKVVLAGTGGDETFGGYPWRYYRAVVNDSFDDYIDKYYKFWQRLIPNKIIRQVFAPIWGKVEHVWTRDIFRRVFDRHADRLTRPEDYVNHSLYFECKTFLHGLLHVDDKLSMAHGLETRVPFLDNDLVDFAMRVPVRLKLGKLNEIIRLNENEPAWKSEKYFQKTRDGKLLLRTVMGRYIPKEVTGGVKQGFSGPDASWFRGESIGYVRKIIFNKKSLIYNFLDPKTVPKLVLEHLEGKANRRLLIWSLICFESWCERFLEQRGQAPPT